MGADSAAAPEVADHTEPGYDYNPSMLTSVGVVVLLATMLLVGTAILALPIEMVMFFSMVVIMILLRIVGFSFRDVQDAAFDSVRQVIELLLILLSVGMLLSAWAMSGTIPTIINYGLELISPTWFLPTAVLLCSVVSLFTGTSWGTMGSVGVALMAVGGGLGLSLPIVAGAVISGAYFGDKLSLLSDSTNLNAAITKTPLLTHIRYMLWTTGPAYVVTLVLFSVIGFAMPRRQNIGSEIEEITQGLASSYQLGLVTLIPLVVTLAMLLLRLPPFIAIVAGALSGGAVAILWQGMSFADVMTGLHSGYESTIGIEEVDGLVSGGGMLSMAGVVLLFMFAVAISGLLQLGGYVQKILTAILQKADTRRKLMVTTSPAMFLSVGLGASFSFGAVMVGTLFTPAYRRLGLRPQNLSRTLEDSGTVYDAFFPWAGGGVFAAGVLGVATVEYMPFMFFAYSSTIFGLILAITQFKVATKQTQPVTETIGIPDPERYRPR
ncbi:Na+/H+ antiporter NhaC [Kocuria coralli]|uniref:Na+/H+ antiporter NhaC n=1 Tax=Kocuria coralli TaxID=1461025 RepID=A0A5J5L0K0_9MICC|nr:Na+/H+ antiporter NhaC [Kocuria coralli]KAA9395489.1 Na+/H+ antiporter NhaC [Kocuria coralli]